MTANSSGPLQVSVIPLMQQLSFLEPTAPLLGSYRPIPIPPFARYVQTVTYPGGDDLDLQCSFQFGLAV